MFTSFAEYTDLGKGVFFGFGYKFQNVLKPFSFPSMEKPTSEEDSPTFLPHGAVELRPLFLERHDAITHP